MKILGLIALPALLVAQAATPVQQGNGIVAGQIHSTNGASVAGVRITAMTVPQPGVAATDATMFESLTTTGNDGRYRLENIQPGRYYITAGLVDLPTYFPGVPAIADARVVEVRAASTLLGIDFTLAQSPGVRVTGRINGIPGNLPAAYIRVMLQPVAPTPRAVQPIEAVVSADGTFEFQRIGPGTYAARTNPILTIPPPNIRIDVKDSDVGPIEFAMGTVIVGQTTVEDGSPLPTPMALAALGILNAGGNSGNVNVPSLVQLMAIRATNPPSTTSFGSVRADGAFVVVNFQPGEYRIAARLPFGYSIKSMSYGDMDLLKTTLKIVNAESVTGTVRVVLTTTPTTGTPTGVKVSGRVAGAPPPANAWISMQTVSTGIISEGGIGETMVRSDGTFEFQRVPPGAYSARVLPPQGMAPQIAIIVSDVDVTNVEVPNSPPPASSAAEPPPALGAATFPGMPAPLAVQPPTYPPGVAVTGRVSMEFAAAAGIPQTVVLFGPRDGLSFQGPMHGDGTFEIQNVPPGTYDARTLPLMTPSVSTRVVVGEKDVNGITLNSPGARSTQ